MLWGFPLPGSTGSLKIYEEIKKAANPSLERVCGLYVRDRIRTHDLLVRSQTLYPAELHVPTAKNKYLALTFAYDITLIFLSQEIFLF